MDERIRACPPSFQAHCTESGVIRSIPLATFGRALGVSVRLKLCLSVGVLWILFVIRGKLDIRITSEITAYGYKSPSNSLTVDLWNMLVNKKFSYKFSKLLFNQCCKLNGQFHIENICHVVFKISFLFFLREMWYCYQTCPCVTIFLFI